MANKKRGKKRVKITVPSLIVLLVLVAVYIVYMYCPDILDKLNLGAKKDNVTVTDGEIEIHIIDVGQADCILFRSRQGDILFDAGTNASEKQLKAYLDNLNVKEFKYVIFTHPHEDHIGGADMILNEYKVEKAIIPDVEANTKTYDLMIEGLSDKDKNIDVYKAKSGDEYSLGDINMKILAPNSKEYKNNLNNYSVVVKVEYGNNSFMMTGDAETLSEKEILSKYRASDLKCDFLKVGHHGSDTSTSEEFLNAVSPSIAAISCGADNKYGHPCTVTLEKLEKANVRYYRTDKEGSLVFKCDGKTIEKKQ